jgi:hypothetical protein
LLERLIRFILESLFLYDYLWFRRGSSALTLAHAALAYLSLGSWPAPLAVLSSQTLFYAASGTLRLLAYGAALAALPASWMAGTQAVLDYVAEGALEPGRYVEIFIRSLTASLSLLYVIHAFNPAEAAYAAYRLGGCLWAYAPLVLVRAASQGLKEAWEAVLAHRLKSTPPWATLAVILLRARESAELLEESYTIASGRCRPRPLYSPRALALQAAVVALDAAALLALGAL